MSVSENDILLVIDAQHFGKYIVEKIDDEEIFEDECYKVMENGIRVFTGSAMDVSDFLNVFTNVFTH